MTKNKKNLKIKVMKDKSDDFEIDKGLLFDVPFRLLLVMRTGGGKSNIIANFFRNDFYGKDFDGDDIYIISPMINDNKLNTLVEFKDIPEDNIITEYDEEIISAIYDKLTEEFSERVEMGKRPHNKVFIFDDVSWSGSLRKGYFNIINKIFCNGRKHNISVIITSQFYNHILPSCKGQASGMVIGNTSEKQLKNIADDNNYLKDEKTFKKMFRENVKEKHDFLVINYSNKSDEIYLNKDFEVITSI
tara:strand:- start:450 stop:1187 length:738 start_codon:yes stop_codon:yes gene_type:complete